jgi:hypothetical protein
MSNIFEEAFKASIPCHWLGIRLHNAKWEQSSALRFTPDYPCDFILVADVVYLCELKYTSKCVVPVTERILKQAAAMDKWRRDNVCGIFLIDFPHITCIVPAWYPLAIKKKSMNVKDLIDFPVLPKTLKRTRFRYDISILGGSYVNDLCKSKRPGCV